MQMLMSYPMPMSQLTWLALPMPPAYDNALVNPVSGAVNANVNANAPVNLVALPPPAQCPHP